MADSFAEFSSGLTSPATSLEQVTPNDANDLAKSTRALNVGESGAVRVTTVDGDTATVYITAGIAFPVRVTRVWATGTTATGIVGLS